MYAIEQTCTQLTRMLDISDALDPLVSAKLPKRARSTLTRNSPGAWAWVA
jgi:hypothetical protein